MDIDVAGWAGTKRSLHLYAQMLGRRSTLTLGVFASEVLFERCTGERRAIALVPARPVAAVFTDVRRTLASSASG